MADPKTADLVLTGGTVLTFDAADTESTALAVADGRVVAVGEVAHLIGPNTQVVDLHGRTVLPGINDSHLHGAWLGALWPGTLLGAGGMAGAGAPKLTTPAERRAAIQRAGDVVAALGITSYTEPGLGPGEDDGQTGCFSSGVLDEYAAMANEGLLRARVTVLRLFGELDGPSTLADFEAGMASATPATDPSVLRIAGVKIFADGIPPMRSAWTHRCYADGSQGHLLVEGTDLAEREANLRRMIDLAHRAGAQIGVHATGDRSIEVTVSAMADAIAAHGPGGRHYLIHGDLVGTEVLARLPELGIGLNTQPGIAVMTGDWLSAALGEEALAGAWPLRRAFELGVRVCLSSDAPVIEPDWRRWVAAAAEWMGTKASPELMRQLLRAYTVIPAEQDGAESWKGSLEVGKVADLCVLEANPLEVSPADLPHVGVHLTVVGGRVVYES
ncbi:putative amidohydrolase YtcJ [Actinokineospora baliensis]|uniref:amidohydrolase n=1 Tax=Actinokineospora baliensis TaxID=547056 RepID=UPI0027DD252D|nr:amidohydrolase family protein [Actinokineospora baliensis]MBM7773771.1 putative amidohydrolase YtcJ [Actinokineospora baliensis]